MKIDLDNITRIVTDIFCHNDNKLSLTFFVTMTRIVRDLNKKIYENRFGQYY